MFESSVKFKVGGREVSKAEFERRLSPDALIDAAKEKIRERIERITCPVHGKPAEVRSLESTDKGWVYSIGGCCDAVRREVHKLFEKTTDD
jgi:hypothetical protein